MFRCLSTRIALTMIVAVVEGGANAREPAIDAGTGLDRSAYHPPVGLKDDFGPYRSPLHFDDGRMVRTPDDWKARRGEILRAWRDEMGSWPAPVEDQTMEVLETAQIDDLERRKVRIEVAPDRTTEGYLLVPNGEGRRPAVLVVYYEPETSIGLGKPDRDFGLQLARRGFVTLSIGIDPRPVIPEAAALGLQPLSYLASWASRARAALANLAEVDPDRIGVMGHSYGGKWAMFAACLDDQFACGVWSDPGVAFDESRSNVNYWEPWYLGWDPDQTRTPGLPTADNPRTGAYKRLVEGGHDLHEFQALMAPRPFLVSGGAEDSPDRWRALNHAVAVNRLLGVENRVAMTNRAGHSPTPESNAQVVRFLVEALGPLDDR